MILLSVHQGALAHRKIKGLLVFRDCGNRDAHALQANGKGYSQVAVFVSSDHGGSLAQHRRSILSSQKNFFRLVKARGEVS